MNHNQWSARALVAASVLLALACNLSTGLQPTPSALPPEATGTQASPATAVPTERLGATLVKPAATATVAPPTAVPATATPLLPVVYPIGPSGFPVDIDPLTGLRVANVALLSRRPLALKVSNFPRSARPQAGLSKADLLFEYYTEGGSTRFLAFFYGQEADKVGPLRSARVEDTRIIPLYDAILVHVQAFQEVWNEMYSAGIDFINEFPASCPAICRDPNEKVLVNSAFGNTKALTDYANVIRLEKGRPNLDGMVFDTAAPGGGTEAGSLLVRFSTAALAEWRYDAAGGRYLRFSEDEAGKMVPLSDRVTGQQLSVANAVILFVPFYRYSANTTSAEMWDLGLSGEGRAVFFRDGKAVEGKWKRVNPVQPLQFFDFTGAPFAFRPGNSWIGVIGKSSTAVASTTQWQFRMLWP